MYFIFAFCCVEFCMLEETKHFVCLFLNTVYIILLLITKWDWVSDREFKSMNNFKHIVGPFIHFH